MFDLECRNRFIGAFALLLCSLLPSCSLASNSTLIQVHVLFRHGDRAPINFFPLDPNNSEDNWPNGWAQLTKEGLAQHQRLGRWFRARYGALVSAAWRPQELVATSTAVDRTLNSAAADLQGLYSPVPADRRHDAGLDWTPVPIRSTPQGQDQLLSVEDYCPAVRKEKERVLQLPEVKDMSVKAEPLFKLLSEKLGFEIKDLRHLGWAYDSFKIQRIHNLTLPDWVLPHLPAMKEYYKYGFRLIAYTDTLKTLVGGPLVSKILTDMEAKIANSSNSPNFFMYSAHDTTVAAHLQTLGLYNDLAPPYAACVIHELHNTSTGPVVRTFYRNDTVLPGGEAIPLQFEGCDEACPVERVRQLMSGYLPTDYPVQCGAASPFDRFNFPMLPAVAATAAVALLLLIFLTLVVKFCRGVNKTHDYSPLQSA